MKLKKLHIIPLLALIVALFASQFVSAAIIGDNGDRKTERGNRFGLKSVGHTNNLNFSLSSIRRSNSMFRMGGAASFNENQGFDSNPNSSVFVQHGSTMVTYNVKYKIAPTNPLPLFVQPSRNTYMR